MNTAFSIIRAIIRYFIKVKIKEDLKSISALLNESRKNYHSGEYTDSIIKADEALRQMRKVSIIIESEISKIVEKEKLKKVILSRRADLLERVYGKCPIIFTRIPRCGRSCILRMPQS